MSGSVAGAAGYGEVAAELAGSYESVAFEDVHRGVLHLLPGRPVRAVDVGAGSGRDAAALARLGHSVVAVEPVAEFREFGRRAHPEVEWAADALPGLASLTGRFGLVWLSAVWMHLDEAERPAAMERVAGLAEPGGLVMLSLRHGPVPGGRRMFRVPPEEPAEQAARCGLEVVHRHASGDALAREGVSWSVLALRPI